MSSYQPDRIWHAADAPEPVRFAAEELARYLSRMTARCWPVDVARQDVLATTELRLSVGTPSSGTPVLAELQRRITPIHGHLAETIGIDAFLWRTEQGEAAIAGTNPRSVLYGVYSLLEALGCRFFGPSPDDEIVPLLESAPLETTPAREHVCFEQADFLYRERHLLEWVDAAATREEVAHVAKRRMNAFVLQIEDFLFAADIWKQVREDVLPEIRRRGLLFGIGEHGAYPLWLPPERYAADHPDWYAEIAGRRVASMLDGAQLYQFCTEHLDARETFLANMETFLRDNPELQVLHPAPEDGGQWCECERCARLSVADRYLRLDNAIAERARRVREDMVIIHLAYANHIELPVHEQPSPALTVSFVTFGRDYAHPITDPRSNQQLSGHPWSVELAQKWSELCQVTGAGYIAHLKEFRMRYRTFHLLPLPHVATDLRWWHEIGAVGVNAPQEGEGAWVKHLNSYVTSRLLWNLEVPTTKLLTDYFENYWGSVADRAREIYVGIGQALPNIRYRFGQPAFLSDRLLPSAERLRELSQKGSSADSKQRLADAAYLTRGIERLAALQASLGELREQTALDPALCRRVDKLRDAIAGAIAGLVFCSAMARFQIAEHPDERREGFRQVRSAYEKFASIQSPARSRAGTLWTGRWRGDALLDALRGQIEGW